ncbi:hypothetical protein [Candidatus Sarmatiella mevalonica]|uniref:hypothetical protein n=1 Tax=Candidatus Sarmatiella mevalonica TaxID=2770581 RepID=UPI001921EF93|nr:hypothetical protein [Candidatus Sarmatiella mevalonica]
MHNLFREVILLSKLLCAPHILEYAAALNIIFPKNFSFIFRLCKRSNVHSGTKLPSTSTSCLLSLFLKLCLRVYVMERLNHQRKLYLELFPLSFANNIIASKKTILTTSP